MSTKLLLELVTPEKLFFSSEVRMAVIPGAEGYFGVLVNHAPMISSLLPGVIDIYQDDTITDRIFISGGFAEVTGERCTVLATDASNLANITSDNVENRLKAANDAVAEATTPEEKEKAEALLIVATELQKACAKK